MGKQKRQGAGDQACLFMKLASGCGDWQFLPIDPSPREEDQIILVRRQQDAIFNFNNDGGPASPGSAFPGVAGGFAFDGDFPGLFGRCRCRFLCFVQNTHLNRSCRRNLQTFMATTSSRDQEIHSLFPDPEALLEQHERTGARRLPRQPSHCRSVRSL